MKLEDLKCEFCDGAGEREINVDGMDAPQNCSFCNGTGIDHNQLKILTCLILDNVKLVDNGTSNSDGNWVAAMEIDKGNIISIIENVVNWHQSL